MRIGSSVRRSPTPEHTDCRDASGWWMTRASLLNGSLDSWVSRSLRDTPSRSSATALRPCPTFASAASIDQLIGDDIDDEAFAFHRPRTSRIAPVVDGAPVFAKTFGHATMLISPGLVLQRAEDEHPRPYQALSHQCQTRPNLRVTPFRRWSQCSALEMMPPIGEPRPGRKKWDVPSAIARCSYESCTTCSPSVVAGGHGQLIDRSRLSSRQQRLVGRGMPLACADSPPPRPFTAHSARTRCRDRSERTRRRRHHADDARRHAAGVQDRRKYLGQPSPRAGADPAGDLLQRARDQSQPEAHGTGVLLGIVGQLSVQFRSSELISGWRTSTPSSRARARATPARRNPSLAVEIAAQKASG